MDVLDAIRGRRAVRSYLEEPVGGGLIAAARESAV